MPKGYPLAAKRYDAPIASLLAKITLAKMPAAIADATWQPGRTPHANDYRPYVNGEPVPGAVAARIADDGGWVDYTTPGQRTTDDNDWEPIGEIRRLFGHVELLRDPYC